jgi:hypothetical protein
MGEVDANLNGLLSIQSQKAPEILIMGAN